MGEGVGVRVGECGRVEIVGVLGMSIVCDVVAARQWV